MEFISNVHSDHLSPMTAVLIAAVVILVTFLLIKRTLNKTRKLPPGPIGLPLLGYLPFLGSKPHEKLSELSKTYGNVIGFHLGKFYTVALFDYEAVKEASFKEEFNGKPDQRNIVTEIVVDPCKAIQCVNHLIKAIPSVHGQMWREQRRFAFYHLKNLGYGKSRMEELIQEEISCFVKEVLKHDGKPFDFEWLLSVSTASNIVILLAGHRLDYNDTTGIAKVVRYISGLIANAMVISFMFFLPSWLTKILEVLFADEKLKGLRMNALKLDEIISKEIEHHKKTLDPNNIRDYIDAFLIEMDKRKDDESSSFNEAFLRGNAKVFFIAGTETSRTVLWWLIHFMACHQDVQEKAYREIVDVIGRDRMPTWQDQDRLPYCQAVIAELSRLKTVVPLSLDRCTTQDTTVQGFDIPKGTRILIVTWNVHNDPKYWKDPEKFDPNRFLSEDGKKFVKNERLIPFSLGKRSCPGEQMGQMETFLYFVALLQQVHIVPVEGKTVDLEGVVSLVYQPKSCVDAIRFEPRP